MFVCLLFLFCQQDTVDLKGIEHVQIYTREIVGATGSKLIVSAPNWIQKFSAPQTGKNGTDGNHGLHGPHGKKFPGGTLCTISMIKLEMLMNFF